MLDVSRRVGVITLPPRKLTRLADRKVGCEMQKPSCSNCSRMGRSCPGYGLRLSWPKGKSRRAFFHDLPPRRDHVGEGASYVSLRFLNATLQDTWLSHELLASKTPQHTSGYTLGAGKNGRDVVMVLHQFCLIFPGTLSSSKILTYWITVSVSTRNCLPNAEA
jgi:hypothetical protein